MLEVDYDLVIIGGGPAGLACAIAAANNTDAKILVVEQQSLNSQRIGENIPPQTLILLEQLGLDQQFKQDNHETCPGFASVWGRDDVGYNDFIVNPYGPSWRLDRLAFDTSLINKAVSLNINFKWNTRFIESEQNCDEQQTHFLHFEDKQGQKCSISAKFVVDASGSRAVFAKSKQIEKNIDDKLVATVRFAKLGQAAKGKQVRIEATENAWFYHTLLPNQQVVTMAVSEQKDVSELKAENYQAFDEKINRLNYIGEHAKQLQLTDVSYHSYPVISGVLPNAEGKNWLAIGDAASSFDPIAAQGIFKALQHGLMAANKIIAFFEGNPKDIDFTRHINEQHDKYRKNREQMYSYEQRWATSEFWQHRQQKNSPTK